MRDNIFNIIIGVQTMTNTKTNHKEFIEKLKNDQEAEAYFYRVIEKCKTEDKKDAQKHMIEALTNLTEAHGGFGNFAERVGLGSSSFYNSLSTIILKFVR